MVEITKGSGNVFEDVGFDPEEAAVLKIKTHLMIEIEKAIKAAKLNQTKAAELLCIQRPRLNRMLLGRYEGVTIDKMVDMVSRTGHTITMKVEPKKRVAKKKVARKKAVVKVSRARKAGTA